jgi:hypothetical protein
MEKAQSADNPGIIYLTPRHKQLHDMLDHDLQKLRSSQLTSLVTLLLTPPQIDELIALESSRPRTQKHYDIGVKNFEKFTECMALTNVVKLAVLEGVPPAVLNQKGKNTEK